MKRFVKWLLVIFAILLIVFVIYLLVPAYPQLLFPFKQSHKNITLYADEEIPYNFTEILEDVESRIRSLEIYDTTFYPNIFLCNKSSLYGFFASWVDVDKNSSGFNLSLLNNTFIHIPRINSMKQNHDRRLVYTHISGNIAQIIAHELVHNLDERYSGFSTYVKKPVWKKEGYCEYGSTISLIRSDSSHNLYKRASYYFDQNLFGAPFHSKFYYKAQLMVEYLFEEKEYTFEMLNDNSLREENVFMDLKNWYKRNLNK